MSASTTHQNTKQRSKMTTMRSLLLLAVLCFAALASSCVHPAFAAAVQRRLADPTPTTEQGGTTPTTAGGNVTPTPTTQKQPTPTTSAGTPTTIAPNAAPTPPTGSPTTAKPSSAPTTAPPKSDTSYISSFSGSFPCGLTQADLPLIITYYESWQYGNLSLFEYPNLPKIILFSFSVINSTGLPADPVEQYGNDSVALIDSIRMFQAKGSKVFLSVGGAENCGGSLFGDMMFSKSYKGKESAFSKVLSTYLTRYGFDGVDFDYECLNGEGDRSQNPEIAAAYVSATFKELSGKGKCVSWSAFSSIQEDWSPYHATFLRVMNNVDMVFWMAYNMNTRQNYDQVPQSFDQVVAMGVHPSRLSIGTCIGRACAFMPEVGPTPKDNTKYLQIITEKKSLGIMVWSGYADIFNATGTSLNAKIANSFQTFSYNYLKKNYLIYMPGVYPPGAYDLITGNIPTQSTKKSSSAQSLSRGSSFPTRLLQSLLLALATVCLVSSSSSLSSISQRLSS